MKAQKKANKLAKKIGRKNSTENDKENKGTTDFAETIADLKRQRLPTLEERPESKEDRDNRIRQLEAELEVLKRQKELSVLEKNQLGLNNAQQQHPVATNSSNPNYHNQPHQPQGAHVSSRGSPVMDRRREMPLGPHQTSSNQYSQRPMNNNSNNSDNYSRPQTGGYGYQQGTRSSSPNYGGMHRARTPEMNHSNRGRSVNNSPKMQASTRGRYNDQMPQQGFAGEHRRRESNPRDPAQMHDMYFRPHGQQPPVQQSYRDRESFGSNVGFGHTEYHNGEEGIFI